MTDQHRSDPVLAADDIDTLRLAVDRTSDVVWRCAPDATLLWVNPAFSRVLGWSSTVVVGRPITALIHPADRDTARRSRIAGLSGLAVQNPVRFQHSDGSWRTLDLTAAPISAGAGPYIGSIGVGRDVTDHLDLTARLADTVRERNRLQDAVSDLHQRLRDADRQAETDLERSRQPFRLAMHHAPIGMALVGLDGSFLDANPALCHIVRYSRRELDALTFQSITHPDDLEADLGLIRQLLAGEITNYRMDKRYIRKDGTTVWVELQVSLVRDPDGAPAHFVSQIVDIDDRREEHASLHFAAHHDPLTGLANRTSLMGTLHQLQATEDREDPSFSVIYCDVDGFKAVNDTFGHAGGDELLREIARRIQQVVRSSDTVARIGGDEFIVAMDRPADMAAGLATANKIRSAMVAPIQLGDRSVRVTVSAGVASSTGRRSHPEDILRSADEAMYRAKREGRNRVSAARQ